jgi:hypothetical protein
VLVLLWAEAWPTLRLVLASLRPPVHAYEPGAVIPGNYWVALWHGSGAYLPAGLWAAAPPLLVFLVVGGLGGWAASRAGRRARLVARCLLVLPMARFVPAVAGAAWLSDRPRGYLGVALLVGTFGLMCGSGVMVYLAAVRGGRRAVVLVSGLAVLGVAAVALLLAFRARLVVLPRETLEAPGDRRVAVAVWLVVVVVLVACGYTLWPWLRGLFGGAEPAGYDAVRVVSATWLPVLPSTLVSVGVAVLAGFGIGALRPFGRCSEWAAAAVRPVAVRPASHRMRWPAFWTTTGAWSRTLRRCG